MYYVYVHKTDSFDDKDSRYTVINTELTKSTSFTTTTAALRHFDNDHGFFTQVLLIKITKSKRYV